MSSKLPLSGLSIRMLNSFVVLWQSTASADTVSKHGRILMAIFGCGTRCLSISPKPES